MKYVDFNSDFSVTIPLYLDGAVMTDDSKLLNWIIRLTTGNNVYIELSKDSQPTEISNLEYSVGQVSFTVDAHRLGEGVLTVCETVVVEDETYTDQNYRSHCDFATGIMLTDGDSGEGGSTTTSVGTLTITVNGTTAGSYTGKKSTIDIDAWNDDNHPDTLSGYGITLSSSDIMGGLLLDDDYFTINDEGYLTFVGSSGGGDTYSVSFNASSHAVVLTSGSGTTSTAVIPIASTSAAGLMSTAAQSFSGTKTFADVVADSLTLGDIIITYDSDYGALKVTRVTNGKEANVYITGDLQIKHDE